MAFKFPLARSPAGWKSTFAMSPTKSPMGSPLKMAAEHVINAFDSSSSSPTRSHNSSNEPLQTQGHSRGQAPLEYSSTLGSFDTINDKVLMEMNQRASRLIDQTLIGNENSNDKESSFSQRPATSLASTAAAAVSKVKHTPRAGHRGHQRFSSIHRRQFDRMESITSHHAVKAHTEHAKAVYCKPNERFLSESSRVNKPASSTETYRDSSASPMKKRKTGFGSLVVSKSPDKENHEVYHISTHKTHQQHWTGGTLTPTAQTNNSLQSTDASASPRLMRPLPRVSPLVRSRVQVTRDGARNSRPPAPRLVSTSSSVLSSVSNTNASTTNVSNSGNITGRTPRLVHSRSSRTLSSRQSKPNLNASSGSSSTSSTTSSTTGKAAIPLKSSIPRSTSSHNLGLRNQHSRSNMIHQGSLGSLGAARNKNPGNTNTQASSGVPRRSSK